MDLEMLTVPPGGAVQETLVDRRTDREWTAEVVPFAIATTPVTTRTWAEVGGAAGSPAGPDLPVVEVSWRDAVAFCNALSRAHGLTEAYSITEVSPSHTPGWRPHDEPAPDDWHVAWDRGSTGFRLPTEAEWQVACRAGTAGPRYGDLEQIAWYEGNSGGRLLPVGRKQPNAWGLHDMLGGVWEWCWDLFDEDVYGSYRIIRGGGWSDPHWSCRAGVRRKTNPRARFDDLGFRVARTVGR